MQRRALSGNPRRNADRLLVRKRALALHEGTVKLLAGSRTRTTLLESPRVDPGLGNIVATLLARRTCLFTVTSRSQSNRWPWVIRSSKQACTASQGGYGPKHSTWRPRSRVPGVGSVDCTYVSDTGPSDPTEGGHRAPSTRAHPLRHGGTRCHALRMPTDSRVGSGQPGCLRSRTTASSRSGPILAGDAPLQPEPLLVPNR